MQKNEEQLSPEQVANLISGLTAAIVAMLIYKMVDMKAIYMLPIFVLIFYFARPRFKKFRNILDKLPKAPRDKK